MGYPMTYQRLVNRSDIRGDYGTKLLRVNTDEKIAPRVPNDGSDDKGLTIRMYADEIDRANNRWSMLCGDLRHLEVDAVDESATCKAIAQRTGIDAEVVAVVLKEFIQW